MSNFWRSSFSIGLLVLLAIASCAAPRGSAVEEQPPTVPATALALSADAKEAIHQLIALEGQTVVSQDIEGLMGLWAPNATITDAKHTPEEAGDDTTWHGSDAIRSRYVVLVFPGNPLAAGARDVKVMMEGEHATARSTTAIGYEVAPSGDRWSFIRRDGRWWIESLTYNLEPQQ